MQVFWAAADELRPEDHGARGTGPPEELPEVLAHKFSIAYKQLTMWGQSQAVGPGRQLTQLLDSQGRMGESHPVAVGTVHASQQELQTACVAMEHWPLYRDSAPLPVTRWSVPSRQREQLMWPGSFSSSVLARTTDKVIT